MGKGCNRPVVLNYGGVPGLIASLLSPVLDASFLFSYDTSLGFACVGAYGMRIIPNSWIDTCEAEMKASLGLLIIMGVSKLPSLEMYCSLRRTYLKCLLYVSHYTHVQAEV